MSRATQLQLIVEEIYGKLAVGYHRTDERGLEAFKRGTPMTAGWGDAYGRGIYFTYDLRSQMNSRMVRLYGNYIIKAKINLDRFLIFDLGVAKRVYPRYRNFKEQAEQEFRMPREILFMLSKYTDQWTKMPPYTSDMAIKLAKSDHYKWLHGNTSGIIFTGRTDGRVIVVYDPKKTIPMGWAEVDQYDLEKPVEFTSMSNRPQGHVGYTGAGNIQRHDSERYQARSVEQRSQILLNKLAQILGTPITGSIVMSDLVYITNENWRLKTLDIREGHSLVSSLFPEAKEITIENMGTTYLHQIRFRIPGRGYNVGFNKKIVNGRIQ